MKNDNYYSMLNINGLGVTVRCVSSDLQPKAFENIKDQERVFLAEKKPFRSVVWPGKRQRKFLKVKKN